ncbi:MAG: hypothetical protein EA366_15880 [Spirulina sp. DLM2.Bin59]|nr:MAG: hypothetical protein EA366_15880 [Spirulina sp. DLM2.Bin59]
MAGTIRGMTTPLLIKRIRSDMSIILRDYQVQFIEDLRAAIAQGHTRICAVLPTGGGKTVVMSALIDAILERGGTAMVVVHRDVLVSQTVDKIRAYGFPHDLGFIKGGREENRTAPIQIASVQTLPRRYWWQTVLAPRVILWDEAHITCWAKVSRRIIKTMWTATIHVGLTATPCRTSKRQGMKDVFTALVQGPLPRELQELGSLCKMRYFSPATLDVEGVKIVAGDYNDAELSRRTNTPEITTNALHWWEKLATGLRTLVFCVDCQHARDVCGAFVERGIAAVVVLGETPRPERDRIYADFEAGAITVIVSVEVLGIGFDCPAAVVGLSLRKTESLSMFLQQVGRLMRPHEDKPYGIWIDMVGNCQSKKLRLPEDLQPWDLDQGQPPGECPTKVCPSCQEVIRVFDNPCPCCGYKFPIKKKKAIAAVELKEINPALTEEQEERRDWFRQALQDCYKHGHSPGFATVRFKERYGSEAWPVLSWKRGAVFGDEPTDDQRAEYLDWLDHVATRTGKTPDWIAKQYRYEFGNKVPVPAIPKDRSPLAIPPDNWTRNQVPPSSFSVPFPPPPTEQPHD